MACGQESNYESNIRMHAQSRRSCLKKGISDTIRRVIAVHSGKGGVGKTFIAVNLAAYLTRESYCVGLLDADIDCPNVLKMLKLKGRLKANANKKIVPLEKFGIKIVSMASILNSEDDVTLWRGPIVSRALQQFIHDTEWGDLDFLIVDLPPGTGDLPITALRILEGCEMVVVSTPHELSLMDARKSIRMAERMGVKVVGILENMSGEIFGESDLLPDLAESEHIPFLGSIPLRKEFSRMADTGEPAGMHDEDIARVFSALTRPRN